LRPQVAVFSAGLPGPLPIEAEVGRVPRPSPRCHGAARIAFRQRLALGPVHEQQGQPASPYRRELTHWPDILPIAALREGEGNRNGEGAAM